MYMYATATSPSAVPPTCVAIIILFTYVSKNSFKEIFYRLNIMCRSTFSRSSKITFDDDLGVCGGNRAVVVTGSTRVVATIIGRR